MFECNVKKVLARRVFKIFSEMRSFLVERFTALTFWLLFSQVKSDIKEKEYLSHTMASPFNFKCFLRLKNEKKRFFGRLRMTSIKLFLNKKPNCQAEFSSASYYRQSEWRLQNVVSKT